MGISDLILPFLFGLFLAFFFGISGAVIGYLLQKHMNKDDEKTEN